MCWWVNDEIICFTKHVSETQLMIQWALPLHPMIAGCYPGHLRDVWLPRDKIAADCPCELWEARLQVLLLEYQKYISYIYDDGKWHSHRLHLYFWALLHYFFLYNNKFTTSPNYIMPVNCTYLQMFIANGLQMLSGVSSVDWKTSLCNSFIDSMHV